MITQRISHFPSLSFRKKCKHALNRDQ
jgi:hypothetical protein